MDYIPHLTAEAASLYAPPVLVIGSSQSARTRGEREVAQAGLRVAGPVSVVDGIDRLADQARASAVWLELDEDGGAPLDELLGALDTDAANGRFQLIVAAPARLLDPLAARLDAGAAELLIDAGPAERAAALALAVAPRGSDRVRDAASDNNTARLRQLSDEVGRIAATLARLSVEPGGAPQTARSSAPIAASDVAPLAINTVRAVIRARRLRARFFDEALFADPAWDMLLDLTQAELAQLRVPVSSLCIAAAVPTTTALRWLRTMTDEGLFVRRADPHDGRRVFVELSATTSDAMRRYFAEVSKAVVA